MLSEAIGRRQGMWRRDLEPLGVLVEHRVDDVDERLVAVEEPVPPGEEVALEPALALVLAEDFHHSPLDGQVVVGGDDLFLPLLVGVFEDGAEAVGDGLVGAEDAEVAAVVVVDDDVAEVFAQGLGVAGLDGAGVRYVDGVGAEVGQFQGLEQQAAVGHGVGAHAAVALGGQGHQLGEEPAGLVEEFLGAVAAHPGFELLEVGGILGGLGEGDLVGAVGAFHRQAVDLLGAGPALGGLEDDHGPGGALGDAPLAGVGLDGLDGGDDRVEGVGELAVDGGGVVALDPVGGVAVAAHQPFELGAGDAGQDGGVGDLVAVEVEDRQHGSVGGPG